MRKINQDGIAHLGLIIVLVLVIAIAAFAFWRVQTQEDAIDSGATQQPTTSEVESTEPIQDAAELEAIEAELEATDIDAELNSADFDTVID